VRYEVDAASGRVHLTARYAGATDAPTLPAFGLEWTLPKQYENLRFYGLAPEETYHDRLHGGKLGIFERTAAEDNAPYLVPQETGMPAANPASARCTDLLSVFLIKNTHAAPSVVPTNGISIPSKIFINITFSFLV
jgi:hypothetical protein